MSIPGSAEPLLLAQQDTGYKIERSLRFNSSDSAYLSRTPASAGNRKTWTWAGWVKRSGLGNAQKMVAWGVPGTGECGWTFEASNVVEFYQYSSSYQMQLVTAQVFRDVSAWFHVVMSVDTTQATASDRVKLYVNGTQITNFSTASYPTQNLDTYANSTSHTGYIGVLVGQSNYFNGYLADVHFIDGQALTPSSFAETNATTGQWVPKAYTGSYGTNGFQLKFADNSNNTAATLGKDTSGNGNNWTPNNLSVTAGAGNDSLVDTPTSYGTDTGAGGEVRGNYCTLNPLDKGPTYVLSNGNLQAVTSHSTDTSIKSTLAVSSGKWYAEVVFTTIAGSAPVIGIAATTFNVNTNAFVGVTATSYGYISSGNKINNASSAAYGASWTTNDVIGVAFNLDAGEISFYKNGVSQGVAYSGIPLTNSYGIAVSTPGFSNTFIVNFGQRPFAYTAPSGFKALCDTNLPAPVVAKPSTVMDVKLYTGNGSTQTISGLGFSPDLMWLKKRNSAGDHGLYDLVRGASKRLVSNSTQSEDTVSGVTSFNSDGFTLGSDYNSSSDTFVAWTWDAGSSTVTNTQGSITSQVRANASAGFSIVTYTGNGSSSQSVGHGLGVAPGMFIIKTRSTAEDWIVWHQSVTGSPPPYAKLNTTQAFGSSSDQLPSVPTSTVINLGNSTGGATNTSGRTYVAYCFAPVAGYSSFGSYTGNGSADGPFVYTGFRPRFVLIKSTGSNNGNWMIYDNKRGAFNLNNKKLAANASLQENEGATLGGDSLGIDFLSNGFKIRLTGLNHNDSAVNYIYAAFAESPFAYSRAR